jgi:uncharacterized protein with HEPN domain
MSRRDAALFLSDMQTAIQRIAEYVAPHDLASFAASALVQDAVIRNLEILGEAARNIPDDLREEHPEIPWRRMIGLRNIVAHQYFGIDETVIWKIATEDVPSVEGGIRTTLESILR